MRSISVRVAVLISGLSLATPALAELATYVKFQGATNAQDAQAIISDWDSVDTGQLGLPSTAQSITSSIPGGYVAASGHFEGTATLGTLSARSRVSSQTLLTTPYGGFFGGARGDGTLGWKDTFTVTGDPSLPAGSPVDVVMGFHLVSSRMGAGLGPDQSDVWANWYTPTGWVYIWDLDDYPAAAMDVTRVFQTTVGGQFVIISSLQVSQDTLTNAAAGNEFATGDLYAQSTFHLSILTPGAGYATSSNALYSAIPEPGASCLVLALLGCLGMRRYHT